MKRVAAILPAAGLGTRMGAETPKQFLELDGLPLVIFTLRRLATCEAISDFFIATRSEEFDSLIARIKKEDLARPVRVVRGGGTRQESVANALAEVPPDTEIVLVHDAVRPLVTREQGERVIAEARARLPRDLLERIAGRVIAQLAERPGEPAQAERVLAAALVAAAARVAGPRRRLRLLVQRRYAIERGRGCQPGWLGQLRSQAGNRQGILSDS